MTKYLLSAAFVLATLPVVAQEVADQAKMQAFLLSDVQPWAESAQIVNAIKAQNGVTSAYAADQINAMDMMWQGEAALKGGPTIDPVVGSPASDFLREKVAASGGKITEVFIMDAKGLNVAASEPTSDYWQGDEDKFLMTYALGANMFHFGEVEFDDSTSKYQAQISLTIADPATGQAIGAMTVGVDAGAIK